ncbi:indole-3-glycerol phosphate synthase 2 [Richelia sinica FACHB-800]|uniref:Indole-3-glycerol phosphate synthase n=1 Tax=Richelia sinica FACHB-800 TaxID=1357546 RepID=A0A975T7E3_9NOST|nr:indole-3-glycerol phosphate synthase TrpC [Richelia sinica]MBD2663596.1 indole-3-glycerol phosphate synthase TrpC [Richelia sinica FACHB-800]QXE22847.1 indole-3-glycerol phosphate synthase 2 [Richelia sinica FACHB-800]
MIYHAAIPNYQLQPIFKEILWHKKLEVSHIQQEMSLASLQRQLSAAPTVRDFVTAIQQSVLKPSLIAEVKKASPYQGLIRPDFQPVAIAQAYERAGVSCISVVTDHKFFQGSFEQLRSIRYCVALPLLCKDFIIDPCQIYLARAAGADAVLLIAAILTDREIQNFLRVIHYLGMNAVVEVHNFGELERVLRLEDIRIISMNNRSLEDLSVDTSVTETLLATKRSQLENMGILVFSDSGIETSADISVVTDAGANGVIMGESFLKHQDVELAVRNLLKSNFPVYKDLLTKGIKTI